REEIIAAAEAQAKEAITAAEAKGRAIVATAEAKGAEIIADADAQGKAIIAEAKSRAIVAATTETQSKAACNLAETQVEETGAPAKRRSRTRSRRKKKTSASKKLLPLSTETPGDEADATADATAEIKDEQTGDPAVVRAEEIDVASEVKCKKPDASETLAEETGICTEEAQEPSAMRWKRTRSKRTGKLGAFTKYRLVPVAP
ncbi:hypothetical protein FB645_005603, partial [Coemansia sp. IMI 203386]